MRSPPGHRGLGTVTALAVGILIYLVIVAAAAIAVLRWPHSGALG